MPYTDLDDFSTGTIAQKEEDLNTLSMDFGEFSRKSSLFSRMYGVIGGFTGGDVSDRLNISNYCLRQLLINTLFKTQEEIERLVGYALTERFIEEEVTLTPARKMQLKYPGVESINVQRSWEVIAGLEGSTIIYYTVDTPTVVIENDQAFVQLPVDVVFNPEEVYIRDKASNSAYDIAQNVPIIRVSGTPDYWKVPIDTSKQAYADLPLVVTDKQFAYVDIAAPVLEVGDNLVPVYPDTNQIVEQARPMEDLGGGISRYWFYVYDLSLPDYIHDSVDLAQVEFYKLYPSLQFNVWVEETMEAIITVTRGLTEQVVQFDPLVTDDIKATGIQIYLVDNEKGIVHFVVDPCFYALCMTGCEATTPVSIKIKLYYKVNPAYLQDMYRRQIAEITTGLLYGTASQLLADSCGCILKSGFINKAQQELGTIITNALTTKQYLADYQKMYGYKIFSDIMDKVYCFSRLVML